MNWTTVNYYILPFDIEYDSPVLRSLSFDQFFGRYDQHPEDVRWKHYVALLLIWWTCTVGLQEYAWLVSKKTVDVHLTIFMVLHLKLEDVSSTGMKQKIKSLA